jgi:hopanoid biosynthesis associated radical SAM protein HpnJ
VARNEFDFTVKEVADGVAWDRIAGLSFRNAQGVIVHNQDRPNLESMDALPFVTPVYKRDLTIENYFIGYLKHPYISLYTGRGCKSRCTFCLWPQTVGGHRYRTRSVGHVIEEIAWAKKAFPQVKEFFFDDDTFTDDLPRAEAIAKELGKLGVTWSCNAKANVPRKSLEVMHANGLRLLLVGYESGNQQILYNIKKGMRIDVAERFTKDCHDVGVTIHGTFILGLPGETSQTIRETVEFAKRINPHTIQVSLAAPYPGTFLYKQAVENGWLDAANAELVDDHGIQIAPLHYPHLTHKEIFDSLETFYREFYFRPGKIAAIVSEMLRSTEMMKRRLREGSNSSSSCANGNVPEARHVKGLIVTADDFGAAREVNDAVEHAHRHGVLTAASLMVGAPAVADAVARAKANPRLRVGLHLVLVEGRRFCRAPKFPIS